MAMDLDKRRLEKALSRYEIIAPILLGYKNISQVARESGRRRKTIREWLRRYRTGNGGRIEALQDRPRRH